jgi:hypothetical protein
MSDRWLLQQPFGSTDDDAEGLLPLLAFRSRENLEQEPEFVRAFWSIRSEI